jgi:hypothetical protein
MRDVGDLRVTLLVLSELVPMKLGRVGQRLIEASGEHHTSIFSLTVGRAAVPATIDSGPRVALGFTFIVSQLPTSLRGVPVEEVVEGLLRDKTQELGPELARRDSYGVEWPTLTRMEDLVREGQADPVFQDGYPSSYLVHASEFRSGSDLDPTEWVYIEAWDMS